MSFNGRTVIDRTVHIGNVVKQYHNIHGNGEPLQNFLEGKGGSWFKARIPGFQAFSEMEVSNR